MFHGIEFDRIGWTVGLTLETAGGKIVFTSDIQGPFIEDYALWIISEDPELLLIDGPPTYLFGYMINRINMRRAEQNIIEILKNISTKTIIYDHHLARDRNFKKILHNAFTEAENYNKLLIPASNWFGEKTMVELCTEHSKNGE